MVFRTFCVGIINIILFFPFHLLKITKKIAAWFLSKERRWTVNSVCCCWNNDDAMCHCYPWIFFCSWKHFCPLEEHAAAVYSSDTGLFSLVILFTQNILYTMYHRWVYISAYIYGTATSQQSFNSQKKHTQEQIGTCTLHELVTYVFWVHTWFLCNLATRLYYSLPQSKVIHRIPFGRTNAPWLCLLVQLFYIIINIIIV